MIALIDADSMVYIIAWNFKDGDEFAQPAVERSCDDFINTILTLTQSDKYLGVFSSKLNFRHHNYLFKRYKGNRGPKDEWLTRWEPIIKNHMTKKWGFYTSPNLEADDIVVGYSAIHVEEPVIICSPDKDLRQAPGFHFDYKKSNGIDTVTPPDACKNLWAQVLTGDTVDNIAGLPGLGPAKVKVLFDAATTTEEASDLVLMQVVRDQYIKYFGPHYGPMIYDQTLQTVMMIQPSHPLWDTYKHDIQSIKQTHVRDTPARDPELAEEVTVDLDALGWNLD